MKKILFLLIAMFGLCQFADAQDAKSVIKKFKKEDGAECVKVPGFLVKMAMKSDAEGCLGSIGAIQVLDLEDCSHEVKLRFASSVKKLCDNGYEMLVKVNDDGEAVQTFIRERKGTIRECIVVVADKNFGDCCMIRMECKVNKEDFKEDCAINFSENLSF